MPPGLECYKNLTLTLGKCLPPCKGIYAGVQKKEGEERKRMNLEKFNDMVIEYKKYKSGFLNDNVTEGNEHNVNF